MGVFLNSSLRDSSETKTKRTCQEMATASLIEVVEAVEAVEAAEAAVATREVEEATEATGATQTEVTRKIFIRLKEEEASTGPAAEEAEEAETARLRSEGQPRNTA